MDEHKADEPELDAEHESELAPEPEGDEASELDPTPPASGSDRRPLAVALAVLVLAAVAGLAWWQLGDGGGGADVAARVDGVAIERSFLDAQVEALDAAADDPEAELLDEVDPIVADEESLRREVLGLLIQTRIINDLAEERGATVPDDEVAARVEEELEAFGGEQAAEQLLAQQGLTLELYREVLVPTQLQIAAIGEQLAAEAGDLETRTVRHVLVETEQEAEQVLDELAAGEGFAAVAEARSIDPGSAAAGGSLGPAPRGAYVPEFEEAVWDADLDVVVGPIETQFGFHVLEVTDVDTVPADELDPAQTDQLVGPQINDLITVAFGAAEVEIDDVLGSWDADTASVLPPEA